METAHSSLPLNYHLRRAPFETRSGANLPPDMYNVNIKRGNGTHFLSLLLHTLVTQREQPYTIHLCRRIERGSVPLWEWKSRNTESDRSAPAGHLEIEHGASRCSPDLDSEMRPVTTLWK